MEIEIDNWAPIDKNFQTNGIYLLKLQFIVNSNYFCLGKGLLYMNENYFKEAFKAENELYGSLFFNWLQSYIGAGQSK
jgi:hypothetical protein